MDEYVYTIREGISIINLKETLEAFQEALDYTAKLSGEGKQILFLGTKKHAKQLVRSAAKCCEFPFVTERWLGGTFTNFEMIKGRIKHLKELERKLESGELSQYTKFERMKKAEEVEKLEKRMGGLRDMDEIPAALFTVDIKQDYLAVKEAKKMGVPIIAIVDTNDNPEYVDYPIPANNDALSSLKNILAHVCKSILDGKKRIKKITPESTKK
jgi:small subunit ribosomal protein S2